MPLSLAAPTRAVTAALLLTALGAPALAQDPEPPIVDRYEVDATIGALPFTPGQTFTHALPASIPQSANEVLVAVTFTCSLISGQIQGGVLVTWTIWTAIKHFDNSDGKASFQNLMWCAPGQLTTSQTIGWLPVSSASRNVFVRLDNTAKIPWDKTQSAVKVVSYKD